MDRDRATSFGAVAEDYDRYRPAPPAEAADWVVPASAHTVVDLGAGTGGFSRVLARRTRVIAVELDLRMAAVAAARSEGVGVINARAECLPLASRSVDAFVASSAWHWMDTERALAEIARVLRPGGTLGVVWNGPVRSIEWVGRLLGHRHSHRRELIIPSGLPFLEPEQRVIRWSLPRSPAELVGLAGTYSCVAGMDPAGRHAIARRTASLIESQLALRGRGSIDLPMAARCWRTTRAPGFRGT